VRLDFCLGGVFRFAMDFLLSLPALVKVISAFGLILLLTRTKVPLSGALLVGGIILGLMTGMTWAGIAATLVSAFLEAQTLSLALIVGLILIMSRLMNDSGHLDRLVASFAGVVRSVRVSSMVMPALIGLLPMPGGALFSAPMVEAASRGTNLDPELKAMINYWFRHIWEYWWPLYPGFVLAVSLLGVEPWSFMAFQSSLTLVSVLGGAWFIIRLVPRTGPTEKDGPSRTQGRWTEFGREARPIIFLVLTIPAVALLKWATGLALPPLTAVFLGLGLCLAMVLWQNHITAARAARSILDKSLPPMLLLVFGIMGFKGILVESRVVAEIQTEMAAFGIPPVLIILLLPFLSGLITGIAIGFVGSSFPLIVPLFAQHQGLEFLAYGSLAFTFGFMGMMLSPVHLCFMFSSDYFSASLLKGYRYLAGPVSMVLAAALIFFSLARWVF